MDYFTGKVYTGEVKDGIATFHVHTSINQDATTGVYRRALLTGWTEVDGPSFNDKQETSRDGVSSSNHLGVYYFANAANRRVYTDRNALGVEAKDEAAKLDSFGPGAYPGHAPSALTTRTDPNPDIHFDYRLAIAAIENGADKIRTAWRVAKEIPEKMTAFLTKMLNIWVQAKENGYMDMAKWKACQVDKIPIDTHGMSVYVGFDMSAKIDLTSVTFVIPFLSGEFDKTGKEIVKYITVFPLFHSESGEVG